MGAAAGQEQDRSRQQQEEASADQCRLSCPPLQLEGIPVGDVAQLMAQDGKHCPVHLLQVSRPPEEELSLLQQSPGHPQLGHLAWGEAGAGVDRPLLGLRYQQGRVFIARQKSSSAS